jgi:hypothetical protein
MANNQGGVKKQQINKENMGYLSNSNGSTSQAPLQGIDPSSRILSQESNNNANKPLESAGGSEMRGLQKQLISAASKATVTLSEIERETLHVNINYGLEIDEYQRELEIETEFNTS